MAYTKQKITTKESDDTVNANERQDTIFGAIKKNNRITIEDLVLLTNVSRRTVTRNLDKLKGLGRIKRVGSDKSGYWEVSE